MTIGREISKWTGNYEDRGRPSVMAGGVHYDRRSKNNKFYFNGNYKIADLKIDGEDRSSMKYFLPDKLNSSISKSQFQNTNLRNKLNGKMEFKADSGTHFYP